MQGQSPALALHELLQRYGSARVRAAIRTPGVLTDRQRGVLESTLDGQDTTAIRGEVSRQAIFRVRAAAVRNLHAHLAQG